VRLGVLGFLPRRVDELVPAQLRQLRALGFTGTGFPGGDDPATIPTARAAEVGRMFRDEGIDLVEYGRYSTTLIAPDIAARRQNLADLREACRVAKAAGCPAVITGAGSHNPRGAWFAHPDNKRCETLNQLIATLREAATLAEEAGVLLGLECHTVTPLKDVATARAVLDAVDSPALRVHLDPVNWMTWETVYESGEATTAMFDILGAEHLLGAHSKGVTVEEKMIIHLSETVTGAPDDLFDHETLLRLAARMPRDFYVVIEHLTPAQMPAARDHLFHVAARIGARFV